MQHCQILYLTKVSYKVLNRRIWYEHVYISSLYLNGSFGAKGYNAVKLRKRFDDNARIPDLRLAKHLLLKGEEELFQRQHPQPIKFPDAPGGSAYEREVEIPDSLLDNWHPMEKAMYPKYFARREQRKKEYMEWYYKEYPEKKLEAEKSH